MINVHNDHGIFYCCREFGRKVCEKFTFDSSLTSSSCEFSESRLICFASSNWLICFNVGKRIDFFVFECGLFIRYNGIVKTIHDTFPYFHPYMAEIWFVDFPEAIGQIEPVRALIRATIAIVYFLYVCVLFFSGKFAFPASDVDEYPAICFWKKCDAFTLRRFLICLLRVFAKIKGRGFVYMKVYRK